jgi:hypothetical protein
LEKESKFSSKTKEEEAAIPSKNKGIYGNLIPPRYYLMTSE